MAKKGKKLWRKAIDTAEIDALREEETQKQRQGPAIDSIPDEQLFFLDNDQDQATVEAVATGKRLRKSRQAPRLLKCQTILNAAHNARAVNPEASKPRKIRGPAFKRPCSSQEVVRVRDTKNAEERSHAVDLWQEESPSGYSTHSIKSGPGSARVSAIELDAPGCSFNPDLEQHQDAVAEAVAAEMSKIYAKEHVPQMKRVFNYMPELSELDALLGAGEEEDRDDDTGKLGSSDLPVEHRLPARKRPERKTEADRNRRKRGRAAEEVLEQKKALKKQRRELDSLVDIQGELVQLEKEQQALAARRAITKAENSLARPAKLGRHTFEPPSVQVLLSEEIDGSLRRLKAAPMLTKERFKSLQKRGVIEPRVRIEPHMRRKRVTYQTGDRAEKVKAGSDEVHDMIKASPGVQMPKSKKVNARRK